MKVALTPSCCWYAKRHVCQLNKNRNFGSSSCNQRPAVSLDTPITTQGCGAETGAEQLQSCQPYCSLGQGAALRKPRVLFQLLELSLVALQTAAQTSKKERKEKPGCVPGFLPCPLSVPSCPPTRMAGSRWVSVVLGSSGGGAWGTAVVPGVPHFVAPTTKCLGILIFCLLIS